MPTVPRRRGRKARVPLTQLLAALTFHVMQDIGTLGEHFAVLFGEGLSDSSCSDRRLRLPWEVFADLMQRVLRPKATVRRHPDAFWRGWRLVAVDGTQFSLTNTPQVHATKRKARTRRGRAAFAKITAVVLLELGLHNPLAAAVGGDDESEWALAKLARRTLPAPTFLARFLQHVLPRGFAKVRHYGLASPTCRRQLDTARAALPPAPTPVAASKLSRLSRRAPGRRRHPASREAPMIPLSPGLRPSDPLGSHTRRRPRRVPSRCNGDAHPPLAPPSTPRAIVPCAPHPPVSSPQAPGDPRPRRRDAHDAPSARD
jgi:hypothetical protein